ncbi:Ger(x)C family spore germination protein [Paenibacillus physcomitrellae]|uniref:Germination protein GerKC n=1 Tax=Paenibacillus physcomitrellae TaxID=1619311 RepID=A0ABQ1FU58_9BACL|nr:Ger(x)C family spore germination protein [Paenibacillus physcomitrellae]GGA29127.1 germination protein GerKC [Paenibacillus physcomitrellae]
MLGRLMLITLLLIGVLFTPGCWSRKELNELAVVMALGIDKVEGGYAVTAQVLNSGETDTKRGASMGSLPVITYFSVGKTIPDALQRMHGLAPRTLYLSHLRVLIFGEKLARAGLGDVMDFIARNYQLRTDFFLLVTKAGHASEILDVVTPFEYIPAGSIYSSILVSHDKWAATGKVTLQQFITELKRDGSDPVLSGVRLSGDQNKGKSIDNVKKITPDTLIEHTGLGVFKGDRLVGWLEEAPSKAVNYVLNEVDSTGGVIVFPEGVIGFNVNQATSSLQVSFNEEGIPEFKVRIKVEADLSTIQFPMDLSQPSTITEIEKRIEEKYNTMISRSIQNVQVRYGADVFGFGEALHRKYPKKWRKYRDNWEEHFKKMKVNVDTKVAIRRIGSIVQPISRESK